MDIKDMIKEINGTFEQFKAKQTELEEKMAKGEGVGEIKEQIEKMQNAMDALEIKMQTPKFGSKENKSQYNEIELKRSKAFEDFMRTGLESKEIQEMMQEYKAMSGSVPSDGGNLIPQILSDIIIDKVKEISPIRQLANVVLQ